MMAPAVKINTIGCQRKNIYLFTYHYVVCFFSRNHFFDTEIRKRTKSKQKEGFVSTERNAVLKGSLGVRWVKARLNEAKLLPSQRMSLGKL